jgi:hypothetical protein
MKEKPMRKVRALACAATALLVTSVVPIAPAAALVAPTITATPSTGLRDSATLLVTGSDWTSELIGIFTCEKTVFDAAPASGDARWEYIFDNCDNFYVQLIGTTFEATYHVSRRGTSCGVVPKDCVVYAMGERESNAFSSNSVPLTFLSAGPKSQADCAGGGWQNPNFVDENGDHFTSEFDCHDFVNRYFLNGHASGTITGTAPSRFGDGCPYIHSIQSLSVDTDRGANKPLKLDLCVDSNLQVTGTFNYALSHGTLTGSVTGTLSRSGQFTATLDVTRATEKLCNVDGTVHVEVGPTYDGYPRAAGNALSHLFYSNYHTCPV